MKSLPSELAFLKPTFESLRRQNADTLDVGDGDFGQFEADWPRHVGESRSHSDSDLLDDTAERLARWLTSLSASETAIGRCGWALVGYMQGLILFRDGAAEAADEPTGLASPQPPAFPPVAFVLPPKWTAQSVGSEWEAQTRGVSVAIRGLSADLFASLQWPAHLTDGVTAADGPFPQNPRLVQDVSGRFKIGSVSGWRMLSRWVDESRHWGASYLLTIPGGHARVQAICKGKTRLRVDELESLVETLKTELEHP